MSDKRQGKTAHSGRQSLFGRLLSSWVDFRRPTLVLLISIALISFLSSLDPITRRALLNAFLAQHELVILLLSLTF